MHEALEVAPQKLAAKDATAVAASRQQMHDTIEVSGVESSGMLPVSVDLAFTLDSILPRPAGQAKLDSIVAAEDYDLGHGLGLARVSIVLAARLCEGNQSSSLVTTASKRS
jgi:hypothetical protein